MRDRNEGPRSRPELPVVGGEGRTALVRRGRESAALGGGEAPGVALRRRGVLQQHEQRPAVPVALLVAFTRRLVRYVCSGDAIWLAMNDAKNDIGATDEEVAALQAAIDEHAGRNFPPGF